MLKRIPLLGLLILLLQACAGVPGVVEAPKVSIDSIHLQDISLTQGQVLVTLNLANPNVFPIPLQGVEYGLNLNGKRVAGGAQNQTISIGAHQSLPVQIPITLDFMQLMQLAPEVLRSRGVNYDLNGAVRLPLISVPFQRQGQVGIRP